MPTPPPRIYRMIKIDEPKDLKVLNADELKTQTYFGDYPNDKFYDIGNYITSTIKNKVYGNWPGGTESGTETVYKFKNKPVVYFWSTIYLGTITNDIAVGNHILCHDCKYTKLITDITNKDKTKTIMVSDTGDGMNPYPISAISLEPRNTVQKVLHAVTRGRIGNGKTGGKRKTKRNKKINKTKGYKTIRH